MILNIKKPVRRGPDDSIWVKPGKYQVIRYFDDNGRLLIDLDAPSNRTVTIVDAEDGLLEQEEDDNDFYS